MCDAPGAKSDALELKAGPLAGTLSIVVTLKEAPAVNGTSLRAERGVLPKRFTRVVPVGWDADVSRAHGTIDAGVLTVHVPRQPATDKK